MQLLPSTSLRLGGGWKTYSETNESSPGFGMNTKPKSLKPTSLAAVLEKVARHCSGASLGAVLLDLTTLTSTQKSFNPCSETNLYKDLTEREKINTNDLILPAKRRRSPEAIGSMYGICSMKIIPYIDSMVKEKGFFFAVVAGIQTSRNAHDLSIPNGIDQVAQHLKAWQGG